MIFLKVLCFCSKKFAQIYNFSLCPSSSTPFRMIYEIRPNIPTFCLSTEGNLEWNEKRASLWWRKHCGFWKRKMFKSISVQLSFLWLCRSKGKSNGKNSGQCAMVEKCIVHKQRHSAHTDLCFRNNVLFPQDICMDLLQKMSITDPWFWDIPNIFREMSDLWNY